MNVILCEARLFLRIMKLTDTEAKLAAQLRKQEAYTVRLRYWCLGLGILNLLGAGYIGFSTQHILSDSGSIPQIANLMFSFMYPLFLLMGINGGILIARTIRDWNGNATRALLLALMDEHVEKRDSP